MFPSDGGGGGRHSLNFREFPSLRVPHQPDGEGNPLLVYPLVVMGYVTLIVRGLIVGRDLERAHKEGALSDTRRHAWGWRMGTQGQGTGKVGDGHT